MISLQDKVVKVIVTAIPFFVLLGAGVIGLFTKEFDGYISFGFFTATFFCVPILAFELIKSRNFFSTTSFILWFSFSTLSLAFPFMLGMDVTSQGAVSVSEYSMLILSFPLGILSSLVHYQFAPTLTGYQSFFLTWSLFAILGFIQWFILLPWVVIFIKRARRNKRR